MHLAKKRISIMIGIAVVVVVTSVSIFIFQILTEELPYQPHLEAFLKDSELTSIRKERGGFLYYELRDIRGDLQGFIFLGEEEGYAGPIRLFVKVNLEGKIQKVHVWEHDETPVYVHPIILREFLDTFANSRIDAELKWQTDIHGLTGATITAESIIRGVRKLGIKAKEKQIFKDGNDVP